MSLYPLLTLPQTMDWSYKKSPKYQTITQTPISGRRQVRASLQQSPIIEFELTWNCLNELGLTTLNDYQYMIDFYESMQGSFGSFIFDPSTSGPSLERLSVTNDITQFSNGFSGLTVAGQTAYPLWRSSAVYNSSTVTLLELIQNISLVAGVYLNGSLVSPSSYTLTNFPATITFTSAPAAGQTLVWAGNYNYLVHFSDDTVDFEEFLYRYWELRSVKLESVML